MCQSAAAARPPFWLNEKQFAVSYKLGSGSFGEVYAGTNLETKEVVAVKIEAVDAKTKLLAKEANILQRLGRGQPPGFVDCFFFGREGNYNCLIMKFLGKSLWDRLQLKGGSFDAADAARMGEQIVRRVEYLHSKGFVHCDIKPENFCFGRDNDDERHHVFMIDFGLSEQYFDKDHVDMQELGGFTGGARRYASINAHRGRTLSRRDDLQAVGHMLLFFLRGSLPWLGLEPCEMGRKKEMIPLGELCKSYPNQFEQYLRYARSLQFAERPKYVMLRSLFQQVVEANGNREEYQYSWITDKPHTMKSINPYMPPRQPDDDIDPRGSDDGQYVSPSPPPPPSSPPPCPPLPRLLGQSPAVCGEVQPRQLVSGARGKEVGAVSLHRSCCDDKPCL